MRKNKQLMLFSLWFRVLMGTIAILLLISTIVFTMTVMMNRHISATIADFHIAVAFLVRASLYVVLAIFIAALCITTLFIVVHVEINYQKSIVRYFSFPKINKKREFFFWEITSCHIETLEKNKLYLCLNKGETVIDKRLAFWGEKYRKRLEEFVDNINAALAMTFDK